MPYSRSEGSVHEEVVAALAALDEAFRQDRYRPEEDRLESRTYTVGLAAVASGLRVALSALAASVGECRVALPYAAIQLVRRPDGSREWCCSRVPPHCDPA
jgi:hypothetical protein